MPLINKGRCLFCESSKLTREHVYSQWMHPYLENFPTLGGFEGVDRPIQTDKGLTYISLVKKRGPEAAIKKTLRVVCGPCNSGWMNKIENKSQPYLDPLIRDKARSIDIEAQRQIALWATMKMMVIDGSRYPENFFTRQETLAFAKDQTIPENLTLYVAKLNSTAMRHAWLRFRATITPKSTPEKVDDNNVGSIMFGVHRIMIFGYYCRLPGYHPTLKTQFAQAMEEIFPLSTNNIMWPIMGGIRTYEARKLAHAVADFVHAHETPRMERKPVRLRVVEKDEKTAVLAQNPSAPPDAPLIKGQEFEDLICGKCSRVLVEGVSLHTLKNNISVDNNFAIRCPDCKSCNSVPVRGTKRKGQ